MNCAFCLNFRQRQAYSTAVRQRRQRSRSPPRTERRMPIHHNQANKQRAPPPARRGLAIQTCTYPVPIRICEEGEKVPAPRCGLDFSLTWAADAAFQEAAAGLVQSSHRLGLRLKLLSTRREVETRRIMGAAG